MSQKVIVIDDDNSMREMVEDFLVSKGFECLSFALASRAFDAIQDMNLENVDAIVTDQNMPEMNGVEFVQRMKKWAPEVPVIIMTAYASIDSAIEATRLGAFSYLSKPFKLSEFEVTLEKAIQLRNLKKENSELKQSIKSGWRYGQLIGKSRGMLEIFELIGRVAQANSTVLITGESGTGKELVARAIHEKGDRANKPFVAINCTAIPDNLLESELFGHVKGSFTGAMADKLGLFEEANGGTIFLDEIGDLDMNLQTKLLRVLQEKSIRPVGANKEKSIDVRVIAATHKDLNKAIQDELFREDLYYRLSVLPVHLPPLRQRKEDIPLLSQHFLDKYRAINNSNVKAFSQHAMNQLVENQWTGNVRELENVIERLTVLTVKEIIEDIGIKTQSINEPEEFFSKSTQGWPTLEQLNDRYIDLVLTKTGGRKEKAAQILGINRRTLYRREKGELGNEE